MAKKSALLSNKTSTKKPRSYIANFEELKADVLGDGVTPPSGQSLQQVPIEMLHRGRYQPRESFDDRELQDLADSIEDLGILEPLLVRAGQGEQDGFEILAGERRWRAAQKAGLTQVPVIVREVNDRTAAAITLVENLQRQDLNPMEEARALRKLMDEFELSQVEIGELVSKSKSVISRSLGLLNLTEHVQDYLENGQLDTGHARVLLNLGAEKQNSLADKTVKNGWSVRELEKRKAALNAKKNAPQPVLPDEDSWQIQHRLSDWLATTVAVKPDHQGDGGKIVINYRDTETRQNILQRMGIDDITPE